MKKYILLVCSLISTLLLILTITQKAEFLGAEFTSEENFILQAGEETSDIAKDIIFENTTLNYDKDSDTYFISIGTNSRGNFISANGHEFYWLDTDIDDFMRLIQQNHTFELGITKDNEYEIINLKITTLPIICIESDEVPESKIEENPVKDGSIHIINADDKETGRYLTTTFDMNYKIRGGTSASPDKKSFKISLVDEDGLPFKAELLGMRNDDDWNLSAVYGDRSKIRESVVLDIYQDIIKELGSENFLAEPQKTEFCELFINNEYMGIYQLTEPVDAQQVNLDNEKDYFYKVIGLKIPYVATINALEGTEDEYHLELETPYFPVGEEKRRYEPFKEFLEYTPYTEDFNESASFIEIEENVNVKSYIAADILKKFTFLVDNDPKNMIFISRQNEDGTYTTEKFLFDFNYSFGDAYTENDTITTQIEPYLLKTPATEVLLSEYAEFRDMYIDDYFLLRQTVLNEEHIRGIINTEFNNLNSSVLI